jgi:cytochrome c-type biogenesis protein CcmH/NrfG
MNAVAIFWVSTAFLSGLIIPFLWTLRKKGENHYLFAFSAIGTIGLAYVLYGLWGNASGIKSYYSELQYEYRQKQATMRPLLVKFRKAEQRYLLRVENNPKDREAWLNLGQIYLIQQNDAAAAAAFEKVGKLTN